MRVYEASTRISAEFGGIRDLSRHLSLNLCGSLGCTNDFIEAPIDIPLEELDFQEIYSIF